MGSVQVAGDLKVFHAQLEKLTSMDRRHLAEQLGQGVRTSTLQRFKTGKTPDGKRWEESTRVKEIGGKTLIDTAGLRKSIHAKSDNTGVAVGSNLKYAATHQFGDENRLIRAKNAGGLNFRLGGKWVTVKAVRVKIPARPYLGINDDDIKEISDTIEDYLMEE